MITQFAHVSLNVSNMAKSVDFYTRHFGLTIGPQLRDEQGELTHAYLYVNRGMFLELIERQPVGEFSGHVSFEADDIDKVFRYCQANGIPVTEPPRLAKVGSRLMFVTDPDGYEIEFNDHSPPASMVRNFLLERGNA